MTEPTPPLTEEELAEFAGDPVDDIYGLELRSMAVELIAARADLRASRAEVALYAEEVQVERSAANTLRIRNGELRAEVEGLKSLAHSHRVEADCLGEIAREWEAEAESLKATVERLRSELSDLRLKR